MKKRTKRPDPIPEQLVIKPTGRRWPESRYKVYHVPTGTMVTWFLYKKDAEDACRELAVFDLDRTYDELNADEEFLAAIQAYRDEEARRYVETIDHWLELRERQYKRKREQYWAAKRARQAAKAAEQDKRTEEDEGGR